MSSTAASRFTQPIFVGASEEDMQRFVESLAIPEAAKAALLELTPWGYTGMAAKLARRI